MPSLTVTGGTLIDGTGADPVADAVVVIVDGTIAAVGRKGEPLPVEAPAGSPILDVAGAWIIPGLINCHDHVFNKAIRNAPPGRPMADSRMAIFSKPDLYLAHWAAKNVLEELHQGTTTIRDLGSRNGLAIQLREAIKDGLVAGPRILACGEAITMTGGHFWPASCQVDGADAVRRAVRDQIHHGADCIKLMASGGLTGLPKENPGQIQFTVEELRAGVEVAHNAGRRVASHAQATKAIENAVLAGVDSIEHGFFLDGPTADLMKERGTHFVPTVNVPINSMRRYTTAGDLDLARYMETTVNGPHKRAFQIAAERGILIATATDSPGLIAEELEIMVDFGFTPAESLRAGTLNAAIVCGIEDETGTIVAGKSGDLVVLHENPLANISAVRSIHSVVRAGRIFPVGGATPSVNGSSGSSSRVAVSA